MHRKNQRWPKPHPHTNSFFQTPKAKATPAAVLAAGTVDDAQDDLLQDTDALDDDFSAAAAVAAAFDAADGALADGEDGIDFDDDELDLDAVALGLELASDDDEVETDGGARSRPPLEPSTDPDTDAALAAFDEMVDAWLAEADAEEAGPVLAPVEDDPADGGAAIGTADRPLCARCYSLTHYGRVKSEAAEASLPEFDVGAVVGRKLALTKFRRRVVLAVVDVADFDGSLPRETLATLMAAAGGGGEDDRAARFWPGAPPSTFSPSTPPPSLILAINKADLLPAAATGTRVAAWARRRLRAAGLPPPASVHLVSAASGDGVAALLADVHTALGDRGDAWVVGAQNAGKSSLLNAFRAAVGKDGPAATAAPLPGTTLGVIRVRGLTPPGCRMLDTPGVAHGWLVGAKLPPAAAAALAPRRPLAPRTYRAAAGQSLLVGGAARLDVLSCPGATLYLTAWVAPDVVTHLGRTDTAAATRARALGTDLQPPAGDAADVDAALGELVPVDVTVTGRSWRASSVDVAVAGLGWVAVAVDGDAKLRVHAPAGVAVTVRDALLPDYARDLARPGFAGGGKKAVAGVRKGGGGGKKGGKRRK